MNELNSNEIKIGILSYIKKRIILNIYTRKYEQQYTIELHNKNLRGILFVENQNNTANDILDSTLQYPILGSGPISRPTIGISQNSSLKPLLEIYGLTKFSYQDLNDFIDEILLNKKWFDENHEMFGFTKKNCGLLSYEYSTTSHMETLPKSLGKTIWEIQKIKNPLLLKKEEINFKTK